MYKLYGYKGSGSAAIEMALGAVNAPYEIVDVASWEPATPVDELTAVNPLTQIPSLVLPGGAVLTESAAILMFLAESNPGARILADEPFLRAKTIQGLVYLTANCYPAVGIIDFPERWTKGTDKTALENIKAGTRERLYYLWDVFADMFAGNPFLSGPQPGILDFLTVTVGRMFSANRHLEQSRPGFYALLTTLEQHPLIAGVVSRHWD